MNGVTFCKVICEKERGVVTASQTGHRLLRITLSEKNNAHFQSAIYSHTSHHALQARVQESQYTITTSPPFFLK